MIWKGYLEVALIYIRVDSRGGTKPVQPRVGSRMGRPPEELGNAQQRMITRYLNSDVHQLWSLSDQARSHCNLGPRCQAPLFLHPFWPQTSANLPLNASGWSLAVLNGSIWVRTTFIWFTSAYLTRL
jgi:hypothetical protein